MLAQEGSDGAAQFGADVVAYCPVRFSVAPKGGHQFAGDLRQNVVFEQFAGRPVGGHHVVERALVVA